VSIYYWFGYQLSRLVGHLFFRFRVIHRDRMIQTGSVILAMNHQSFLDPPLGGINCDRDIYFLARRSLLDSRVLGWLLPKLNVIPVDQEGIDRTALKTLIRVIKEGNAALVFPEGTRTPDGTLQPAQPGVGLIIAKTRAPVVPMRIFGAFDAWPIGGKLRLWRAITVVIGDPIFFSPNELDSKNYQQLSQRVMDAIAELKLE